MSKHDAKSGMAARSICESILLALNDAHVLPESEIIGVLEDAAAHENTSDVTGESNTDLETHKAVAALINRIVSNGNSIRRT